MNISQRLIGKTGRGQPRRDNDDRFHAAYFLIESASFRPGCEFSMRKKGLEQISECVAQLIPRRTQDIPPFISGTILSQRLYGSDY